MHPKNTNRLGQISRSLLIAIAFAGAGSFSFFLGIYTSSDVETIEHIGAQAGATNVNVILQYQPIAGGDPLPIEVTPLMNPSNNALLHLQDIFTGQVVPSSPSDRCLTTNSVGRCNLSTVPVGGNPEQQYDLFVDINFLEFLTSIPLEPGSGIVRFDPSECGGNTTAFEDSTWCLTKPGGTFAQQYFVTITLNERDVCAQNTPPANFCDSNGNLVNFVCNLNYGGPTAPFEPVIDPRPTLQCPDGNFVQGVCEEFVPTMPAYTTFASCAGNQLCSVQNISALVTYTAGQDSVILRGQNFGALGGLVTFVTQDDGTETVEVFPGADWTDTQITVPIPAAAVTGPVTIHPHSHGSFDDGEGGRTDAVCNSPSITIRGFADLFTLLAVNATVPGGVQLVSPGFDTNFSLRVHHNDSVSRLSEIDVELIEGAFLTPADVPLQRTVLTHTSCPVEIIGDSNVQDATVSCSVPVPETAAGFIGPFTFVVTLSDDTGAVDQATLVDAGSSALIGDFDFSGDLSINDAVHARRIVRGVLPVSGAHLERDTDHDGQITQEDVLFILHSLTQ